MNHRDKPFTKVTIIDNLIEAQLLISILKEQDLPHQVISQHNTAYDGLFQMQKGGGNINAPSHYHAAIKKIIETNKEKNT
jgi:hypothetical protein